MKKCLNIPNNKLYKSYTKEGSFKDPSIVFRKILSFKEISNDQGCTSIKSKIEGDIICSDNSPSVCYNKFDKYTETHPDVLAFKTDFTYLGASNHICVDEDYS